METEILSDHQERLAELVRQVTASMEPHLPAMYAVGQHVLAAQDRLANAISGITLPRLPGMQALLPDFRSALAVHEPSERIIIPYVPKQQIDHDLLAEKIAQRLRMKPRGGHKNRASYPLPKDARLSKLKIKEVDGHTIKIRYPGLPTETFDYKDLGMEDRRRHTPDCTWEFVCAFFGTGRISGDRFNSRFNRNTKYRANERLQKFFETNEDFFHPYDHKDSAWAAKPQFISPTDTKQFEYD